jgi:hypothetical protein
LLVGQKINDATRQREGLGAFALGCFGGDVLRRKRTDRRLSRLR